METRANHLLIGAFAIGVIVLAFVFALWMMKFHFAAKYAYYDVVFPGGVSGLPTGGEVRYSGVKVGTVDSISFSPTEPGAVIVRVKLQRRPNFALHKNSEASLEYAGITGVTYVLISGGTNDSPVLPVVTDPEGKVPTIVAQPSAIEQLFTGVPDLVAQGEAALKRINTMLSPENEAKFNDIIANLDTLSRALADKENGVGPTLTSVHDLSKELTALTSTDGKEAIANVSDAAKQVSDLAQLGDAMLAENREAINSFTVQGLGQVGDFVSEARELVSSIDRIAQRVESDPTRFILGGSHSQEMEVHQ
jgi:phospholipid/cholesterol/gamma-HCH transport system substrate-binding protein